MKNQVTLEFLKTKVEEIVSSFASNKRNFPKELVDEVTNSKNLKIALYKHMLTNRNTRIRIVSPEKVVRFNLDINKYAPYGTSVFDNSVIPANNELLSNSATLIGKLLELQSLETGTWRLALVKVKNSTFRNSLTTSVIGTSLTMMYSKLKLNQEQSKLLMTLLQSLKVVNVTWVLGTRIGTPRNA